MSRGQGHGPRNGCPNTAGNEPQAAKALLPTSAFRMRSGRWRMTDAALLLLLKLKLRRKFYRRRLGNGHVWEGVLWASLMGGKFL